MKVEYIKLWARFVEEINKVPLPLADYLDALGDMREELELLARAAKEMNAPETRVDK